MASSKMNSQLLLWSWKVTECSLVDNLIAKKLILPTLWPSRPEEDWSIRSKRWQDKFLRYQVVYKRTLSNFPTLWQLDTPSPLFGWLICSWYAMRSCSKCHNYWHLWHDDKKLEVEELLQCTSNFPHWLFALPWPPLHIGHLCAMVVSFLISYWWY